MKSEYSNASFYKANISLRNRIFLAMTGLVVLSSFFMAIVTLYQYQEQSYDYHKTRLNRKELQLVKSLQNELRKSEESIDEEHLKAVFENEIYSIASIHNVDFSIYNLAGELLLQSNFIQENIVLQLFSYCLVYGCFFYEIFYKKLGHHLQKPNFFSS